MELDVLYQDEQCVAVNKPSGLLVHRTRLDAGSRRFALQLVRDQVGRHVYPVHRLDKPTSGVLLFALDPESARGLVEAFARREVRKRYLAVVRGHPEAEGRVDRPLRRKHLRIDGGAERNEGPPRRAVTDYRCLATVELPYAVGRYPVSWYALVEARPLTGRRHQIRRHLAGIDHPIIGDYKHGDYRHNRFFRDELGCARLLLAATELTFPHPATGAPVRVTARLDDGFEAVLHRLGMQASVPPAWRPEEPG